MTYHPNLSHYRAGISAEVFTKSEFDRATLEIHTQESHQHGVLFNEGEIPRSDSEFFCEHSALPIRVGKLANSEFSPSLNFTISFAASIYQIRDNQAEL